MVHTIPLAPSKPSLGLECRCDLTPVVRNALSLFREELVERHGAAAVPDAAAGDRVIVAPHGGRARPDDQGFELAFSERSGERTVTLTADGERGVLYGLCELLDGAGTEGGRTALRFAEGPSRPDVPYRGNERHWGPAFDDPEENLRLIRLLARRRVNTLCWAEGWIRPGFNRFLTYEHFAPLRIAETPALRSVRDGLRRIAAAARDWGMDLYLGCTEFNVPERALSACPEMFTRDPESGYPVLRTDCDTTWRFYRAKIREAAELLDGLAGIELWTAEAMDCWRCPPLPATRAEIADRLRQIYDETLAGLDEAGRPDARVIVSCFVHHADGEAIYEPLYGRLPARCDARMKSQVEDFYRFNEPTTLAGRIAPGREWIEMDTGGEHRGDWVRWITAAPAFTLERMRHYYHACGVRRFLSRVRGTSLTPGGPRFDDAGVLTGTMRFKHDVFFAACWDIDRPLEELWAVHKPGGWPDAMLEFLLLSERVAENAIYVNRCLVLHNHSSFLESLEHFDYRFKNTFVYGNEALRPRQDILEPTEENLARVAEEKDRAVADAERMSGILDACREELPADDYAVLREALDRQLPAVRTFREYAVLYWRWLIFLHGDAPDRLDRLMAAAADCERAARVLLERDRRLGESALAFVANVRSRAWVACCSGFAGPKGMVEGY